MVNSSAGSSPALPAFQLSAVTPVHRYRPGHPGAPLAAAVPPPRLRDRQEPSKFRPRYSPLTKRKAKQRAERVKDKVPHDVRQRYVNMFTEELLKSCPTVKDAFEKLKYLSIAVNALKRLKNQSSVPTKDEKKSSGKRATGNVPLNTKQLPGNGDAALYESLKEYVMNEEKMIEHNFPLQNPERPGGAILFADHKKAANDRKYSSPY
ncbi:hypothetical protein CRUP_006868 [Coryphaenoides rupestris]|nr:hypothetical protein CRUP_006868 [Coryphaenoides rupestris]